MTGFRFTRNTCNQIFNLDGAAKQTIAFCMPLVCNGLPSCRGSDSKINWSPFHFTLIKPSTLAFDDRHQGAPTVYLVLMIRRWWFFQRASRCKSSTWSFGPAASSRTGLNATAQVFCSSGQNRANFIKMTSSRSAVRTCRTVQTCYWYPILRQRPFKTF